MSGHPIKSLLVPRGMRKRLDLITPLIWVLALGLLLPVPKAAAEAATEATSAQTAETTETAETNKTANEPSTATPGDPLHDHLACFEVPEGALRQARALVPVQARARLGHALVEAHVRELRDHLRLVRVGVSVGTVSNRIVRVW